MVLRSVLHELMSEGLIKPVVMIRRGDKKFIGGPAHPSQLFDLRNDPLELCNLALDQSFQSEVGDFEDLTRKKWDFDNLVERISLTQTRRRLIQIAHRNGVGPARDYMPPNEQKRWLRGECHCGDWTYADLPLLKR